MMAQKPVPNSGGMINLPEEVWDKLRELQEELDEGKHVYCGEFSCKIFVLNVKEFADL